MNRRRWWGPLLDVVVFVLVLCFFTCAAIALMLAGVVFTGRVSVLK